MIENASRYLPLVRLCFLMLLFPDLAVRWDCHNYHNCFCSLSTTIMSGWLANSYLSVWRLKYLRTLAVLISARYIWGTDVPVLYPSHLVMSSNEHCCYYMPDCLYGVFAQSVTWIGCDSCVLASVDLEPSWGLFMYCHGLATGRVSLVCHLYITWQGLILHNTSSSLPPSLSAISCLKHSCSSSSQGHASRCIHAGCFILDHGTGTPLFCCSQSCRVLDLDESLHAWKGIFTSGYLLLWLAYHDICVADDCWTCGLMAWDLKAHFSVFFIFGDFGEFFLCVELCCHLLSHSNQTAF